MDRSDVASRGLRNREFVALGHIPVLIWSARFDGASSQFIRAEQGHPDPICDRLEQCEGSPARSGKVAQVVGREFHLGSCSPVALEAGGT